MSGPTRMLAIRTDDKNGGKYGLRIVNSRFTASGTKPRLDFSMRNMAPADQACGSQETGYQIGLAFENCFEKPQKSSGRRKFKWPCAASNKADIMRMPSLTRPTLHRPSTIKALSCGQTEPL